MSGLIEADSVQPPSEGIELAAERSWRRSPALHIGLPIVLLVGVCLTVHQAIMASTPFADALTCLEPARNLLEGRGFITRFNVVYGWSGTLSHPGLAYYNPLYGMFLGLIWQACQSPALLSIAATVVPCILNAVLIAAIVYRSLGGLGTLLCVAGYLILPTTCFNIELISAEHPTVTFGLVLLLLVQRLVPKHRTWWLLVGVVLGVSYLFRVAMLAAAPALMAGLLLSQCGGLMQRVRLSIAPALLFAAGVALVLVPFHVVCRISVGRTYPEYPLMARNWSMATLYGGEFVDGSPAVRPDAEKLPRFAKRLATAGENVHAVLKAVAGELGVLTLLILLGLWGWPTTQSRDAVYLLCMGAAFALVYGTAYYWIPFNSDPGTPARYCLDVAGFWYPLGIAGLLYIVGRACSTPVGRGAASIVAWVVVSIPSLAAVLVHEADLIQMDEPRVASLVRAMAACRELTGPDDLIAVPGGGRHICGALFLDRPIVAMPQQELDDSRHLERFIQIYKPQLVILGDCRSAYAVMPRLAEYEVRGIPSVIPKRFEKVYIRRGTAPAAAAGATRP